MEREARFIEPFLGTIATQKKWLDGKGNCISMLTEKCIKNNSGKLKNSDLCAGIGPFVWTQNANREIVSVVFYDNHHQV